jgi:hypothetical protein
MSVCGQQEIRCKHLIQFSQVSNVIHCSITFGITVPPSSSFTPFIRETNSTFDKFDSFDVRWLLFNFDAARQMPISFLSKSLTDVTNLFHRGAPPRFFETSPRMGFVCLEECFSYSRKITTCTAIRETMVRKIHKRT